MRRQPKDRDVGESQRSRSYATILQRTKCHGVGTYASQCSVQKEVTIRLCKATWY